MTIFAVVGNIYYIDSSESWNIVIWQIFWKEIKSKIPIR